MADVLVLERGSTHQIVSEITMSVAAPAKSLVAGLPHAPDELAKRYAHPCAISGLILSFNKSWCSSR